MEFYKIITYHLLPKQYLKQIWKIIEYSGNIINAYFPPHKNYNSTINLISETYNYMREGSIYI